MKDKTKLFRSLCMLALCCCAVQAVQAVDYHFKRLTSDEHLSQNYVDDIYKDSKGFMWFATWGGLDRYDGYTITSYHTDNSQLKSNFCYCLAEDAHARLWVGSDLGLSCINLNTGHVVNLIDENSQYRTVLSQTVHAILCDHKSNLWVAGDHGLACLVFDEQGEIADFYSLNMVSVLALAEDSYGRIWMATSSGELQCLSNKHQGQFDFESIPPLLQQESFSFIRDIYVDRMGILWIANSLGLCRYNPHTNMLQNFSSEEGESSDLPNAFVNDVVQDNQGNIWVATLGGLALWHPETADFECFQSNGSNESINNNFLNALYVDDQNILWIGTEKGGVNWMFEKRKMIHSISYNPTDQNGIFPGPVNSVLEDSQGNLWVGLVEGGLHLRTFGSDSFEHFVHSTTAGSLSQNTVSKIYEDSYSHIWVGTWGGGLNRMNASRTAFESFVPGDEEGSIASNFVSDLVEDSLHQGIWVGMNNGLQFFDLQTNNFLNVFVGSEMSNPPQQVNFLKIDRKQRLWVATNMGLYCFYLKSFDIPGVPTQYEYFRGVLHEPSFGQLAKIISIYEGENAIWFGSNGNGLYKMEELMASDSLEILNKTGWDGPAVYKTTEGYMRFSHYDSHNGFADNVIYTILEDENDRLWMSTNKGLIRYDPLNAEVINFNKEDGLLSNQFYWMAACKSKQGLLYFGNLQGLNYVEPRRFKSNDYMPRASLISLQILNNKVEPGVPMQNRVYLDKQLYETPELVIPKKDKSFSLEFSSLDYEFPERIRYAYFLEGFDKQWTIVGAERRFVHYTNLQQGRYEFMLRCTNSDGQWSDKISRLPIIIRPPLHQSLLFRVLFLLLVLGMLLYWFMTREKRNKQKQLDLEVKVKDRTRELEEAYLKVEELNQEKISVFTNITHEFKTPITLIMGPIKRVIGLNKNPLVQEQLHLVERNAERLLSLVNQLMDFRKVEENALSLHKTPGNMLELVREVLYPFADLVEKRFIHCSLISKLKQPELFFDSEILRKILSNLLSNAVKYTPDYGSIKLKLFDIQKDNKPWVRISVSDSGKGIPEEELEKIFERFYQIKDQKTYQVSGQSGTGVGLFLCRELVQIHGGVIYATNNRLGGARFVLEFPAEFSAAFKDPADKEQGRNFVKQAEKEAVSSEETPQDDPQPFVQDSRDKAVILLVEDYKDMRQFVASFMQDQYTILEASDGEEAWAMVQKHLPDIVISDVMMPRMDGIQLCRNIKSEFRTSHIPVILLTALNSLDNQLEGLESGANDYVSKPLDERLLKAKVFNILQFRERIYKRFDETMNTNQVLLDDNSPDKNLLDKLMFIVQKRYADPSFTVSVFVDELGVSRSLLHKKLQSLVGQSAGRFLRNFRLNKAKEFLSKNEDVNISEVAYSVGFNDPKYFTRCFTKRYGVSPSNYFGTKYED